MGPFDPNAMTPGMSGLSVSLGNYHSIMEKAWEAKKRFEATADKLSNDELRSILACLNRAEALSRADEDMDAHSFWNDIKAVQSELEKRSKP